MQPSAHLTRRVVLLRCGAHLHPDTRVVAAPSVERPGHRGHEYWDGGHHEYHRSGRKEMNFFILAPNYIFIIVCEATSELELYQMVWLELEYTVKLFHGGSGGSDLFFI